MEKKYKVEFGKINKLFICEPNELQRKVKESFKIQQPFQFQVYDDDFAEWIGVTDIEQLPTLSKLKVEISKCTAQCTLHILQRMNRFLYRFWMSMLQVGVQSQV